MKNIIFFSVLLFLIACSQTEQKSPDQYSIEQFYKNTRFDGGSFSEDETRLLVSSDESGIFNVYEITINDGLKKQITISDKESYYAIDYVPGTDQILYTADKGGNEINHIYLLQDDSLSVDLTPAENENTIFGMWSEDKKSMFYLSNKRDDRFFDMYKMKIADWKSEMVYRNDEGLDINDISHDENIFILTKYITTSENKMFLFDRRQNRMTEISEEPGNYNSSGFSKDDSYLYYITNTGKEFAYLVQYDIATGKRDVLYETNWDVMYSYLSENDKYRVIAINQDGKNNLILLDNSTQSVVDFPEIPDGDIKDVNISESEKQIRLTVGTSKAPNNIYVYNFEDKSLKKLTESLNPEINPDDLVSAEVVRFNSFDDLEIPAIFYKPLDASKKNKVPALVWVHGGPGGQSRVGYFALIQYLVNHGYAILAVNNRGSSGYGKTFFKLDDLNHGDKDLKDCIWGKKWLQEQEFVDSEKIGILGGSYGGFMTMAAMAFTPDEFKVGVNLFGVTNWLRTLKSIPPYWQSQRAALFAEMGDPFTEDSVRLYNISPLFHAENIKNPIMVLQGANDPRVLQVESDEIVAAVKNNNVPVEYIIFLDEGHGFVKKENEINGYGKILEFLGRYLKGETGQEISGKEQCEKLGRGVNIIGYDDELWEDFTNGRFKEKYFKMIKEAGFTNIRINMHPFSHMDGSYKINDKWIETLDWAVKNGLEANLMIILDLHEFHAMAADPVARKEMFLSFWRQLALRYKDLPDDVVFEILNEPNGKLTADLWNSFLVEAVDLIRKTNPHRTLMIGPGNWNGIESLPTLVLPEDDHNIIVTVHFYHPMNFTHQGAPWAKQFAALSGITWTGTEKEKEEIDSKLQVAADWAEANDRPIYLGEFGAYDKADMDSRARYIAYVARTAEKFGFSWGYWQFDSDFILYNIDKEEWVIPLLNALTD